MAGGFWGLPRWEKSNLKKLITMKYVYVGHALEVLAKRISNIRENTPSHRDQSSMLEWIGAGVKIRSISPREETLENPIFAPERQVTTVHARALTWLLLELRDAFGDEVDFSSKFAFYGALAEAAQIHLGRNQPEPSDPRPLLYAVFAQALHWSSELDRGFDASGDSASELPLDPPCRSIVDPDLEGTGFGRN